PRDDKVGEGRLEIPSSCPRRKFRGARSGRIGARGEGRRGGIAEAIARRSNEARRRETARDRAANFPGGTLAWRRLPAAPAALQRRGGRLGQGLRLDLARDVASGQVPVAGEAAVQDGARLPDVAA